MRIAVLHPAMRPDDPFAAVDAPAEVASLMPEHTFIDVVVHKATVGRQLQGLRRQHIDVVVNLCDGAWDEDRPGVEVIHGLERLGLPYTGADARCYDPTRLTMKLACEAAGVPFPAFAYADGPHDAPAIAARLRPPYIVKHPQGYGSLDLLAASKVDDLPGLTHQIARITAAHGSALVEEFIVGREFMVLVAEPASPGDPPRTWAPAEVLFAPGESFRHFDAKWHDGSWMQILADPPLAARLRDHVARAFTAMGAVGYARCDLRMTEAGEIHLLELNANCGVFMPPDMAAADEMLAEEPGGRREFLAHILACALRRHAARAPNWTLQHDRRRGFGLVAARPIRPGEVILSGDALPHNLAFRTSTHNLSPWLSERPAPDPTRWRPLDHACDPSAQLRGQDVTARRPIAPGERISIDHATLHGVTAAPCTCDTIPCRAAHVQRLLELVGPAPGP